MSSAKAAKPQGHLPNLNEAGFILGRLVVVLVAISVALISFFSGGDALAIALRTGIAVLAVGLIAWFVNWLLIGGVIDSMNAEQKEKEEANKAYAAEPNSASTIEKSA